MQQMILVIDDEAPLREEIADQLSFAGYQVIEAENGVQGVEQAAHYHPDAIICDISMPEMDGYEVLMRLRQDSETAVIPFIFLTAHGDRSFMRHGMELGADDFLSKPFTRAELLAAIESRLQHARVTRSAYQSDLEESRRRMVLMITHELRTPLIGLKMASELLEMYLENMDMERIKSLSEVLRSGGNRMHRVVEQCIMMFRLDSAYITEETIRSEGIVNRVDALLMAGINDGRRFATRNHELSISLPQIPEDCMILGVPQLLKQAVAEVVANALNFSPPRSEVQIDLAVKNQRLRIAVIDRGMGMSADSLRDAVKPFEQIDRASQEQQGIGMGLALTDKIVTIHGGSLRIDSVLGKGTRAIIELPLHINHHDEDSSDRR